MYICVYIYTHTNIHTYTHIHTYIYMSNKTHTRHNTHTPTHNHINIDKHMYPSARRYEHIEAASVSVEIFDLDGNSLTSKVFLCLCVFVVFFCDCVWGFLLQMIEFEQYIVEILHFLEIVLICVLGLHCVFYFIFLF